MAMDLLDRLWAGEFNLDDQSNWIVKLRDWVITIPLVWLGINIFAMLVFVLWLTNYMHKLVTPSYSHQLVPVSICFKISKPVVKLSCKLLGVCSDYGKRCNREKGLFNEH